MAKIAQKIRNCFKDVLKIGCELKKILLYSFLQNFSEFKMPLEYKIVNGKREGSELLYAIEEKILYLKKIKRGQNTIFRCYQRVLSKSKEANDKDGTICNGEVTVDEDGICYRRTPHSQHEHHEHIMNDLESFNTMKKDCRYLNEKYGVVANKISEQDVFCAEMKK